MRTNTADTITTPTATPGALCIERAGIDRIDDIVAMCGKALRWDDDSPNAAFFRWKHLDNPFGSSPMWIATDGDEIVGVRSFLRWEFRQGDRVQHAVRAVDTATHPDHQGRGIFKRLTLHAVEELTADGVGFVFNTPNVQSKPGYLKMGWRDAGAPQVAIAPTGPTGLWRLRGAKTAAGKWSLPTRTGVWAPVAFESAEATQRLLDGLPTTAGLQTNLDASVLQWRFAFAPLNYRVLTLGDDLAEGALVFRLRTRGTAVEAAVAAVLAPTSLAKRSLLRKVRREARADYVLAMGADRGPGLVPAPGLGPDLTVRELASTTPPDTAWHFRLADIELL